MSAFFDPDAPRGPEALLLRLKEGGTLLFPLMGWAAVALGLAQAEGPSWIALVGLVSSALQRRALALTLAVEILVLSAALTLAPPAAREWMWTGIVLIGVGRTLSFSLR